MLNKLKKMCGRLGDENSISLCDRRLGAATMPFDITFLLWFTPTTTHWQANIKKTINNGMIPILCDKCAKFHTWFGIRVRAVDLMIMDGWCGIYLVLLWLNPYYFVGDLSLIITLYYWYLIFVDTRGGWLLYVQGTPIHVATL